MKKLFYQYALDAGNINCVVVNIAVLRNLLCYDLCITDKSVRIKTCPALQNYFTSEEESIVNKFKNLKRKTEWLAGRLAVKELMFSQVGKRKLTIIADDYGKPYLSEYPQIPISISHSNDYAIGIVDNQLHFSVGVDIEKNTGILTESFIHTAFTQKERENHHHSCNEMFVSWTIKEAYLKYLGMGFHECLKDVEVINRQIIYKNKIDHQIQCKSFQYEEDYIISIIKNI